MSAALQRLPSGCDLDGAMGTMNVPNNNLDSSNSTPVGPVFMIGVSGGTASGKTSVCRRIIQDLGDLRVSVVSMDSFYKTLPHGDDPSQYNFDHPDAFDYDLFADCLGSLVEGQTTNIPLYSFETHSRLEETVRLVPTAVIIVEGILIFHDQRLRDLMHMKVFVDTDADTRLLRRIKRDIRERGRSYEGVLAQYERTVKPSYDEYIAPTKRYADIIIPHWPNEAAVDLITHQVRAKMGCPDIRRQFPNLAVMNATATTRYLHTVIRDRTTPRADFVFHADRLIRLLAEYGTAMVPWNEKTVTTPMGEGVTYIGVDFPKERLCAVSMVRAGTAMETGLAQVCQDIRIGKLLFNFPDKANSGENVEPMLVYQKLPKEMSERFVFLLEPVIGKGLTVKTAVELLKAAPHNVPERHIIVLSLMTSPEAVKLICKTFPALRLVTTEVDGTIDAKGYLLPGVGDFANRYFGTEV